MGVRFFFSPAFWQSVESSGRKLEKGAKVQNSNQTHMDECNLCDFCNQTLGGEIIVREAAAGLLSLH